MHALDRVFHQLEDLGWVDFYLGSFYLCLILLRQMVFRQNRLSNQARRWNISNISQPDPGMQADGTPCRLLSHFYDHFLSSERTWFETCDPTYSLLKFNSITEAAIEEERRRELQNRLSQLGPQENEEDEVSQF